MKDSDKKDWDIIDEDLYEEIDPEEMYELVQEERQKLKEKEQKETEESKKRPFLKWAIWSIAIAMFIQVIAVLPQTFSIPAFEFIKTSAQLMQDQTVQDYRKAVVVIEGENNKGTGFSISENGYILTNYHVIEDQLKITVAFKEEGLFNGEVVDVYPEIDLALLQVEADNLPYLSLANKSATPPIEDVYCIGNPLRFNGIANKGGDLIGMTQLTSWDQPVYMLDAPSIPR
ncbi:serine protease precursor MucD/AlgY associated with sigma factor RpoE [Gracilibacillus boraciitolerans JCM 21714]|uniref:Serine protease MucD/AlgY associated with sigma factor RpoE n=1 Tax=Gracilibacillus boraciitolerans JCM 21714 TaxID=1298598 RepID=W4VJN2_9BACI|nr:serine protease precursor MucD/AlgY associated with sigma factor RpoE [Gracilibacillus boraciitolerans JCM 21714]